MGEYYFAFLHSHALFWLITIIFFGLTVIFLRVGKQKLAKVFQMILRLLYVLVFITGSALVFITFSWESVIKGLLAIWLIYVMELITNRMAKDKLTSQGAMIFWAQFIVAFVLVLYFGYIVT